MNDIDIEQLLKDAMGGKKSFTGDEKVDESIRKCIELNEQMQKIGK